MKYDLELFNSGDYYIRLETKEKYDEVMEYLHENGYKWRTGDNLNYRSNWEEYFGETCILVTKYKLIGYAYVGFYGSEGKKELKAKEPKQDLRELLQVGQKISNEYQTEFIGDEIHLRDLKSRFNENLYSGLSKTTIDEIYRKKYNGIKPMEWALVWKREEERFTLRLKGNVRLPYYAKGNSKTKYDYTFRKNNKPVNEEKYQVRFTQEDIEKLPKELVALLEKEKVQ